MASLPPRTTRAAGERTLRGFGRVPTVLGRELLSESLDQITHDALLSRGLGRSYGDAALPPSGAFRCVASSRLADRLIAFDSETGVLRAEAGTPLVTLNQLLLPRGWFTPVTPGTAYVTLGGMVAADVHGKNHHVAGAFGEHVRTLRMRVADGRILDVDEASEPELFRATLGGMGLTGHILEVEFRMQRVPSPWIWQEKEAVPNVETLITGLAAASSQWPMTVAWIDSTRSGAGLGRGVLWRGRWAEPEEAPARPPELARRGPLRVPCDIPSGGLNRYSLTAMNAFWYAWERGRSRRPGIVSPIPFFYPLDAIGDWTRLYGTRGFTQYQCVLPSDPAVFREFLELFQRERGSSFVSVVKDCGPAGRGMLSFPKPGTSIALDIPIGAAGVQRLIDALNDFTQAHDGRIYLAKDAFTRADHFRAMYPELEHWNQIRRRWDPEGRLRSAQSVRLLGDAP